MFSELSSNLKTQKLKKKDFPVIRTSTAESLSSIPGQGTKISKAMLKPKKI